MTTDTTPLTPTEDELMELGHECELDAIEFGRAVLARWGTPAPVGVEPVARLEIGKTKGGVSLTHIAEPAAFQLQEGMYALYTTPQPTQAQAGPISGVKSFQTYAEANAYSRGYYAGKKAAKQPQGGAVPLTDEQIHAIYDEVARREPYAGAVTRRSIVRAIEAAHGIKGGQHGTE